ncbi:Luciferase-like domain-containing protein [Frankia sp. AiPs1]|uniref:TIGR03620 family F420-dependent LLM class oxidoreductase n=1 Tax=Frankia sp. AiPa1 TaxID=573492 RepID=UPI00202B216F|nr:TIGR03620 family F420-dependent LLM class oxidoreductase [Frankia sp. AiPa1]MCL9759864.1 TIGR03620 family F420-dependent LLM class oxidoreductase [Frankia sp. AiPa1]
MTVSVGRVGIWSPSFAWNAPDAVEAAVELDELGYGALWLGASAPDLRLPERLLAATSRIAVATGIVNVWAVEAVELAAAFHRLDTANPERLALGLGVSHAPIVRTLGRDYAQPLRYLDAYLDALDAAPEPVPAASRVLAALRPKALALAAARSAGAHPYLVTPEHTASARRALGEAPLLAPEQKVILETDPAEARALARYNLSYYFALPNYVRSLRTLGFDEDDFADNGSERLIDALYAWGTVEQIAKRVAEHHAAGADHVAVQVIFADTDVRNRTGRPARAQWRALAPALL